jgi:hypothetical protein
MKEEVKTKGKEPLKSMSEHLTMENPEHRTTVESVYNKWLGPDSLAHSNEGMVVQQCVRAGAAKREEAQRVSPRGMEFDVQPSNLSDRMFNKYSDRTREVGGIGERVSKTPQGGLSDRKYK